MARPICLITGATGALGPAVVAAVARTHDVRTLSRHAPPAGLFHDPVMAITGDITDRDVVRTAVAGADAVVHMAALLHIVNPDPALRPEYQRINVDGTAAVMEASRASGVQRVVLVSTIAVYGSSRGELLTEESPPQPDSFYAETKLAAERLALEARRPDGIALASVLRLAAVYGPRVKGNYRRLLDAMQRGRFVPIGPGVNRRTLIFEEDVAEAVALGVTHPAAAGRIYNVSDGRLHAMRDILAAIAGALGQRTPRWSIPVPPVRLVLRAAGLVHRRFRGLLDKYLEEVTVDATRIQQELGFRPRYGLNEGWVRTIERIRTAAS